MTLLAATVFSERISQ